MIVVNACAVFPVCDPHIGVLTLVVRHIRSEREYIIQDIQQTDVRFPHSSRSLVTRQLPSESLGPFLHQIQQAVGL